VKWDIYIGAVLVLAIGIVALVYGNWIGHALIGITDLVLMIYVLATGAMLRGRIKKASGNIFDLHKRGGIYLGAFILGLFIYGLWLRLQHGEPILLSIHGKLGLIIVVIALLQVIPSLLLKNRAKYRRIHRILGYSLGLILIIDATWGLYEGVTSGTKSLVLLHSISGGLVVLTLAWIILEILYPTEKSLQRARVASYASAFLLTAGCWIAGGYNYLKDYGSQVKPVILAGPTPWVHEIIMEMKEHIFVFLPIIAFALSLTMYKLDRDAFLADVKSRRALLLIASLALFLVLLMFIMGAVISNTGNIEMET